MPKRVCQCARMIKSIRLFFQQNSQIDPMDPSKAVFTIMPEKFRQKDEIFRSFLKTIRSPTFFSKETQLSSKFTPGHVEFRFDNLAGGLLTQRGKKSPENGNDNKKHIFFKSECSIKFSLGLVECSFYKLKVFAHCPKRTRESSFFKNFSSR